MRRALLAGAALLALIAAAVWAGGGTGAPAQAAVSLPLPQLPHVPIPHLAPGSPPPRPSRSPPERCAGNTDRGRVPYAGAVFPCDFADPMVLKVGRGTWYAYATGTGWERGGRTFPILVSHDLRHWRAVGHAFRHPPGWTVGALWAPTVLKAGRTYFMYYSASRRRDHMHCVAVATARRPAGPFRARRVISCRDHSGRGEIDAAPLRDRRGTYLFFSVDGPRHSISVLRLRHDLLRASGRRKTLFTVSRRWQRGLDGETVEGPYPMRYRGRYYLFYSAGSWLSDYRMGYAVARSPTGPYHDFSRNPILQPRRPLVGPGGGSVFPGRGHTLWLAFHAWSGGPGYDRHGERTLRIAPVRFRGDRVSIDVRGRPR